MDMEEAEEREEGPWAGTGSGFDPMDWCCQMYMEDIFVF